MLILPTTSIILSLKLSMNPYSACFHEFMFNNTSTRTNKDIRKWLKVYGWNIIPFLCKREHELNQLTGRGGKGRERSLSYVQEAPFWKILHSRG